MINLEQRSAEWHAWRREGIGSSEAAILMGCTNFRSLQSLWRDKCGLENHYVPVTTDMQRGIDNEDPALRAYCFKKYQELNNIAIEPITLQHEYFAFMRASLDGAHVTTKHFVEIKCPRQHIHEKTAKHGTIKAEYFCQMQHQYLVSEYLTCDFISYDVETEQVIWVPVEPDFDYQAELLEREILFWEHVVMRVPPDEKDFPLFNQAVGSTSSTQF